MKMLGKILLLVGAGAVAATGVKTVQKVNIVNNTLKYFKPSEFGASLPFLNINLLKKLDLFRERLGRSVIISPAAGALIRPAGSNESQHIIGNAADIMLPKGPDLKTAYDVAKAVGFTGVGVYPDWKPYAGLHLDVRNGTFVSWAGVKQNGKQVYVSVDQVLIA
jgi:hypothetical protein